MKLNKKKWFNKNVLSFTCYYKPFGNETLMYYSKYDQIGGLVDSNFMRCDTQEVAATKRKLSRMSLVDAFFYCRYLKFKYPDKVGFSMVTIKDAL